ncbi:neuropeptide FF receptor 1-like isoform X2 [Oculina patagonica]
MSMSGLGWLILASCVWKSIAKENISNHNETDPKKVLRYIADLKYSLPTKVIFTSAMLFTFLVSVIGNSLVIYVITKHRSMRTSTNCLIMNLAVCDLLITVLMTPTFIKQFYSGDRWFGGAMGNVTCKLLAYVDAVLLFCSIFSLVAIAVDRFLAVTRPLTYKVSSKWVVKIAIPGTWFISGLLSITTAMTANVTTSAKEHETPICYSEGNPQQRYSSMSCLVVSLVVLTVLYSIIVYRLWRRNIPGEVSSNQHALAIRTARKVTVLMISIVIVFVVSWAPVFVVALSSADMSLMIRYPLLFAISYWLVLNNSACNPCLYFIFIESFRESLKTACLRCRPRKLRLCRIGQERRFETEQPMRDRQTLNAFTQEERAVELTALSSL